MKLETVKKNLEKSGIICTYKMLCGDTPKKILCCVTNYSGPYPTKETFNKIEFIRKTAKGNKTECRGYYTAVFIYE